MHTLMKIAAAAVFALGSTTANATPEMGEHLTFVEINTARAELIIEQVPAIGYGRAKVLFSAKIAVPQVREFLATTSGFIRIAERDPEWSSTPEQRKRYPGLKAYYGPGDADNPLGRCQVVIRLYADSETTQYLHIYGGARDDQVGSEIQGGYIRVQDDACPDLVRTLSNIDPIVEVINDRP